MKGLDGIQGPIYVGTGCVFRRQALYGYDAPKKKKPPSRTCNCWPKWCFCCCCCGTRKNKSGKSKQGRKFKFPKFFRRTDNRLPVNGTTEENGEGTYVMIIIYFVKYIGVN